MGASETGDDVFLVTTVELAKAEGLAWGIYDARVNAVVPQEVPPTECQGESCRGERTRPTEVTSAGTASFEAINRVSVSAPKSVRAGKVKVRVIAPGDGTISISGRGVKPIETQASRAGSVTLTLALKPSADKRRQRAGAYRTKGEVLFVSAQRGRLPGRCLAQVRSIREQGEGQVKLLIVLAAMAAVLLAPASPAHAVEDNWFTDVTRRPPEFGRVRIERRPQPAPTN